MAAYYINDLLSGYSWTSTGTKANLTYSFLKFKPSYSLYSPPINFSTFSAAQKAAALYVMNEVSSFANVKFTNVEQSGDTVGHITWGNTYAPSGNFGGMASYPASSMGGDIWVNSYYEPPTSSWNLGTYNFLTLMHELGHALGLKHSFEGPNALTGVEDSYKYTVMAYPTSGVVPYPSSFMLYDIAALQYLYGANTSFNSGNNTYDLTYLSARRCIWDGGGNDTLDASASTSTVKINLSSGSFSSIGYYTDNLSIAYNCTIENANGGSGNDTITGNSAANILMGNAGSDRLYGGNGNDTLYGGDGDDHLIGGDGTDILNGGNGNDYYYIDNSYSGLSDKIIDASGIDTIQLEVSGSGSYTMVSNIENLNLSATTDVDSFQIFGNTLNNIIHGDRNSNYLYGNDGNDIIYGENGNDHLYGGNGNDKLIGGIGNDVIMCDSGSDSIDGGSGTDTLSYASSTAGVNVNLAKTTAQTGGYASGDTLISIENIIGSSYNDTLLGSAIANAIYGGSGKDIMTGAGGADLFQYSLITDSGKVSGARDIITDFVNGIDKIDLSAFAGTFVFKGTGAFTHTAHEIDYAQISGNTIISADADGNGVLDFQIELSGLHNMTASDFLL